jgi:simple sugar transport system ATP-binding protein
MHADAREMLKGWDFHSRYPPAGAKSFRRSAPGHCHRPRGGFDPKVLIMDEPTAALAVAEVEAVLELIRRVSARGVSVILITHRLQDLFLVCDRIMVMYEGTNVADRRVADTSLSDIVNLIVGEKFTARSAAAH